MDHHTYLNIVISKNQLFSLENLSLLVFVKLG
jgi:hypothetical protein